MQRLVLLIFMAAACVPRPEPLPLGYKIPSGDRCNVCTYAGGVRWACTLVDCRETYVICRCRDWPCTCEAIPEEENY